MLIRFILFVVSFVGIGSMLAQYLFKYQETGKYRSLPFITSVFVMAALYIGFIFGVGYDMAVLIWITGAVYFVVGIHSYIKNRRLPTHLKHNISINIDLYLFLLVLLLFCKDRALYAWDEFSFWGGAVKTLVETDKIHGYGVAVDFANYPRATAMLQYYLSKIIAGKYVEGVAQFSQLFLFVSFAWMLISGINQNLKHIRIIRIVLVCFLYAFATFFTTTEPYLLYADVSLSVIFSAFLYLFIISNKTDSVRYHIPLYVLIFLLPLVKEMGALLGALACALVIAYYAIFVIWKQKSITRETLLKCFYPCLSLFSGLVSWKMYLHYNGISASKVPLSVSGILNLTPEHKQIAINYVTRFFRYEVYFVAMIVVLAIAIAKFLFRCKPGKIFWVAVATLSIIIIYNAVLAYLYMVKFSPYEGVRLASYERYTGTLYFSLFAVAFVFLFELFISKIKTYQSPKIGVLLLIIFLAFRFSYNLLDEPFRKIYFHHPHLYSQWDEEVQSYIDAIKSESPNIRKTKVYCIDQESSGYIPTIIRYKAIPLDMDTEWRWTIGTKKKENGDTFEEDVYTAVFQPGEFKAVLKDFDYLIINNDKGFWENYTQDVIDAGLKGVFQVGRGRLSNDELRQKLDAAPAP